MDRDTPLSSYLPVSWPTPHTATGNLFHSPKPPTPPSPYSSKYKLAFYFIERRETYLDGKSDLSMRTYKITSNYFNLMFWKETDITNRIQEKRPMRNCSYFLPDCTEILDKDEH